mmetsp:Transcript_23204/g.87838  ORF Transcript_23204/g.87838 Transcript_23204/m.87838 type:complete len:324 (-) Transcript_23204:168-1139(-)
MLRRLRPTPLLSKQRPLPERLVMVMVMVLVLELVLVPVLVLVLVLVLAGGARLGRCWWPCQRTGLAGALRRSRPNSCAPWRPVRAHRYRGRRLLLAAHAGRAVRRKNRLPCSASRRGQASASRVRTTPMEGPMAAVVAEVGCGLRPRARRSWPMILHLLECRWRRSRRGQNRRWGRRGRPFSLRGGVCGATGRPRRGRRSLRRCRRRAVAASRGLPTAQSEAPGPAWRAGAGSRFRGFGRGRMATAREMASSSGPERPRCRRPSILGLAQRRHTSKVALPALWGPTAGPSRQVVSASLFASRAARRGSRGLGKPARYRLWPRA